MPKVFRSSRAGVAVVALSAALLGGYAFSYAASACLARLLPLSPADAVIVATLPAFIFYTGAILWAFASRDAVRAWAPCFENYTFLDEAGGTRLRVDCDVFGTYEDWMREVWPKALLALKTVCEETPS